VRLNREYELASLCVRRVEPGALAGWSGHAWATALGSSESKQPHSSYTATVSRWTNYRPLGWAVRLALAASALVVGLSYSGEVGRILSYVLLGLFVISGPVLVAVSKSRLHRFANPFVKPSQ